MSGVPYIFANATTSIPLNQLDTNFATPVTIGNTTVALGNTVTSIGNLTLTNVTIASGTSNVSATSVANGTSNVSISTSNGNVTTYTNGVLAQTVDTNQNSTFVGSVNSPNTFGFKNRIINGAFGIWQRGTSFSSFPSGTNTYTVDRFSSFVSGTGATIAVTQQAVTPTTFTALGASQDPQYYLQYQCSVLGSVTYMDFNQRIEDVRTFAGQNMTVSFYAKADTSRTIGISLYQNFGSGGSADVSGSTTNVTIGTSWTKYTVTIACNSISGKTIGAGSWVGVVFALPVSTFTLSFALVQAELGSTATSFDWKPYSTDLALCERYFYTVSNYPIGLTQSSNYLYSMGLVAFPTTMRATPTISGTFSVNTGSAGTAALVPLPTGVNGPQGVGLYNSASNWTTNVTVMFNGSFSAEL